MSGKYRIWSCKIVVPSTAAIPLGFDWPPRQAAIKAVEKWAPVVSCFSGWDGKLTEGELAAIENREPDREVILRDAIRLAEDIAFRLCGTRCSRSDIESVAGMIVAARGRR